MRYFANMLRTLSSHSPLRSSRSPISQNLNSNLTLSLFLPSKECKVRPLPSTIYKRPHADLFFFFSSSSSLGTALELALIPHTASALLLLSKSFASTNPLSPALPDRTVLTTVGRVERCSSSSLTDWLERGSGRREECIPLVRLLARSSSRRARSCEWE